MARGPVAARVRQRQRHGLSGGGCEACRAVQPEGELLACSGARGRRTLSRGQGDGTGQELEALHPLHRQHRFCPQRKNQRMFLGLVMVLGRTWCIMCCCKSHTCCTRAVAQRNKRDAS